MPRACWARSWGGPAANRCGREEYREIPPAIKSSEGSILTKSDDRCKEAREDEDSMINDARLIEVELLSQLSQNDVIEVTSDSNIPRRDMIVHLLIERLVNDVAGYKPRDGEAAWSAAQNMFESVDYDRNINLVSFLRGQKISMRISHKGRIRLAELEQSIKSGREREPFGILYNAKYWERDLRIALLSASAKTPVALCFLDMNGLKVINDKGGHEKGNEAIRAFLRTVAANVEGVGDAYRYGGDEVVVILPASDLDAAENLMTVVLKQLGEEKIDGLGVLTASCGVGCAFTPFEEVKGFIEMVDKVQYDAKIESKVGSDRRSALAVVGRSMRVL